MSQDLIALNKDAVEAARQRMNQFAWPTALLTMTLVAVYGTNLVLVINEQIPFWMACIVFAATSYMAYTPLHEAVHGNINGRHSSLKWLNDLCGYLSGQIIMVPYSTHRPEHLAHHRHTNHPEKDPDYMVHTMGDGPLALISTAIRFLWAQISFMPRHQWPHASNGERLAYVADIGLAVGWRVMVISQLSASDAIMLFLVSYIIAGGFLAYWFAFRPHFPYEEQARYKNTSSLIMPLWLRPLEWFWLGQNLHSIHHLFPRVPFYRYHDLHREIEPIMRAHGTPIIGIYSRQPEGARQTVTA